MSAVPNNSALERKSLSSIFKDYTDGPSKVTAELLTKGLCDSLAPLLLLTRSGLRGVGGIGKQRMALTIKALEASQLRLRLDEERVHNRAKALYGSVEDTPAQALLVVSALSSTITFSNLMPSPAVQLVTSIDPTVTMGQVKQYLESGMDLFFSDRDIAIDNRRIRDAADELSSRMRPWEGSM